MNQKRNQKKWMKLTAWIALFSMIFSLFSPATSISKAALSPLKYYQQVEKANINKQIDSLTKGYSSYISAYQEALKQESGAEVTLKATLDPTFANGLGLEGLTSLKASVISMVKGTKTKSAMNFYANDKQLTSVETYADLNGLYYYLIPDLSKSFLKVSLKDLYANAPSANLQEEMLNYFNAPIPADVLNKILKKYSAIAINKVSNVTMKKDETVTVDKVSSKYTRLTVRINERTGLNIANDILKSAQADTSLRDTLIDLNICTKTEYNNSIKKAMKDIASDLKALKKSNGSTVLTMSIWVDKNDNIVGRSIIVNTDKEYLKLGYKTVRKGTTVGLDAWISEKDYDILRGTGSFTAKLSGATGTVKISMQESSKKSPEVINVNFKDVKYTQKDNTGFINGEFDVTSKLFNGLNIKVKCNGDSNKQDFIFDILQSGKSLVNIALTAKEVPYQDFSLPTSADKSYDMMTQLNNYLLDADMKGFLQKIKDRSDVKVIDDYIDAILKTYVE
ncbi:hypothetical protein EDD66_10232 [Mobilisporobacter senegalensis]|uniref:Uncharacterized protein n=1 Tax=Mobilisporobacter senegalensis TaxID=1329262 RepID=A0A3N1XVZ6_9FIRM|nr:hypothetical protein [Mobilisporobacter senegalensis]ROR30381.1 hypothetical protein EDD66_10232 [Mobilisporobacter senegalensis]